MRVALITQDFPPEIGGIETYSHEISRRFSRWCDYFTVYAPLKPGSELIDRSLPFPVRRRGRQNTLLNFALLPGLPYEVYRQQLDVSFHAQWGTVLSSVAARSVSGLPLSIFSAAHARELLHNPLEGTGLAGLFRRYQSHILQRVDHWFPVSSYTRDLLVDLGVEAERTTVIHNGTDPDRFHPFDAGSLRGELGLKNRKVLMTTTRLVRRKGIDDVIRAVDRLRDEFPDIAYVIVGKGPEEKGLREMVRRRRLGSHVYFTGEVDHKDLAPYYNLCDLFVMPAKTVEPDVEGFGIVFLEANACGKPVIGSTSGGIPDAVVNGENGLLVDEKNIDQLVEAIRQLLDNPDRAVNMGKRGRKRVEKMLNWDAVARKLYEAMQNKITA